LGNLDTIAVILEEIGHWFDSQINLNDTLGDEGELFATIVTGKELRETELTRICEENDKGIIYLGEEAIDVEKAELASQLDLSFGGGDGIATQPNYNLTQFVLPQPDGKIIVVGDNSLTRYNSDGMVDPTFPTKNIYLDLFPDSKPQKPRPDIIDAVLQPDGKILVLQSYGDDRDPTNYAIIRYNNDGSLDETFNPNGEPELFKDQLGYTHLVSNGS
jgi:uncharacterized delta-60 repeat protein